MVAVSVTCHIASWPWAVGDMHEEASVNVAHHAVIWDNEDQSVKKALHAVPTASFALLPV